MNIAVIGLGLIGGSLAKCIKKLTPHTVLGTDISEQVVRRAKLLDAIDGVLTPETLPICDMVLVATWPQEAVDYVTAHADNFAPGALVMDVCGVKQIICEPLWALADEKGFTFVGGHPMAGIEYSGFDHAVATLFENASMILTPPRGADIALLDRLKQFWCGLGFGRVVITTPEDHDRMIAYTSQLPHVVSSAFIKSPSALRQLGFSAGSYRDMTRVAKLNEDMWTALFMANQAPLLHELDLLMEHLAAYRAALAEGDPEALRALLKEGRELKAEADRREH